MWNRLALRLGPRYRFVVLAVSAAMMFVAMGSIYVLVTTLKPIATEFGWPRAVPSLGLSLQFLGGGLGGIFMGAWLDRFGMGMPAFLAALMLSSGAILTSLITNQWQLYLIYGLMMGLLGQGGLATPVMANLTRWFDRRRGAAIGIVAGGQSIGGTVWPPLVAYMQQEMGWRGAFLWYGVFAGLVMTPLSLALRQKPPEPRIATGTAGKAGKKPTPATRAMTPLGLQSSLCCAIIGCCVAMSLPLTHIVAHVSDIGHPLARGAEILSLMLFTSFFARVFVLGFLVDRFGGITALLFFSTMQTASLLALALVGDLGALYVVAVMFGLGYGGIFPSYPIIVREHLPVHQVGRRAGIVLLFGAIGMALGGWLGGFVFDRVGSYSPAFFIGIAFNIGNLFILGYLTRRVRAGLAQQASA